MCREIYIFLDVSVACLPFVQIIFIFICSTLLCSFLSAIPVISDDDALCFIFRHVSFVFLKLCVYYLKSH